MEEYICSHCERKLIKDEVFATLEVEVLFSKKVFIFCNDCSEKIKAEDKTREFFDK